MIQRLTGQLPSWARTEHPVMRYELGKSLPPRRRARFLRALGVVLGGMLLLVVGYLVATHLLQHATGQNITESASAVLFWPLLAVQILTRIASLTLTASAVSDEMRRQNWDNLRATERGAELSMRARWAAVFYRLRGLLAVLVGLRVLLIVGILWDLTAFQGRYLDLLINGITPDVPLVVSVLLLSFLMTAALLLPLTAIGFDASIGLLLSTLIHNRTYNLLSQVLFILVRTAVVIGLLLMATTYIYGTHTDLPDVGAWVLILAFAAMGDWGLAFLWLGFYGEMWATVPYGIFFGLGLLIFALLQAALTDRILIFAIHRAERKG
jgi:hypothetical protein